MAEDLLRREPCGRNTGMGDLRGAGFGLGRFSMQMHRKIRNVPFPRPYGATGNDAQKLHASAFAHFHGAAHMHEVLLLEVEK